MDLINIVLSAGVLTSVLSFGSANSTTSTTAITTEVMKTQTTQAILVVRVQPLYTACYGQKIEASCRKGENITIYEIHAHAKPLTSHCHLDKNQHRTSCCEYEPTDCSLDYTGSNRAFIFENCNGRSACIPTPVPWMSLDNQYCKQELFPRFTTYITLHYGCTPPADGNSTVTTTSPRTASGVAIVTGNLTVLLGLAILWLLNGPLSSHLGI